MQSEKKTHYTKRDVQTMFAIVILALTLFSWILLEAWQKDTLDKVCEQYGSGGKGSVVKSNEMTSMRTDVLVQCDKQSMEQVILTQGNVE